MYIALPWAAGRDQMRDEPDPDTPGLTWVLGYDNRRLAMILTNVQLRDPD